MSVVGTVVEQTQHLLDRQFVVSAYLPVAVTGLVVWLQIDGAGQVVTVLGDFATQTTSTVVAAGGLVLLGLYLLAFVVHGLRRPLRQLWSGRLPPARLSDLLVSRAHRRRGRLRERLEGLADQHGACLWMATGFDDHSLGHVRAAPTEPDDVRETLRMCRRDLAAVGRPWPLGTVERARRLAVNVWRLAGVPDRPEPVARVLREARDLLDEPRAARRMAAAAVRVEQRFFVTDERLERAFPPESGLHGTAFGNVLARTDHYSMPRYGIPLSELWPRLRLVASDQALREVDDALVRVDFAVALSTGALIATAIGGGLIVADAATPERVALSAGAAVVAVAMYRFAVAAAHLYSGQVAAVVDLHLADLGDALYDPAAPTRDWDALYHFYARADPLPTGGQPTDDTQQRSRPGSDGA